MYIYQIKNILEAVGNFARGDITLLDLSQSLKMPYPRLELLFLSNQIIDLRCDLQPNCVYQDIVNVVLLYYAMSKKVEFKEITFHKKVNVS